MLLFYFNIIKLNDKIHSLRYRGMIYPMLSYAYRMIFAIVSMTFGLYGTYHTFSLLISPFISITVTS